MVEAAVQHARTLRGNEYEYIAGHDYLGLYYFQVCCPLCGDSAYHFAGKSSPMSLDCIRITAEADMDKHSLVCKRTEETGSEWRIWT